MKLFHKVVPYVLAGSAIMMSHDAAEAQTTNTPAPVLPNAKNTLMVMPTAIASHQPAPILSIDRKLTDTKLIARAENTVDLYIGNMLAAEKRLRSKVGTKGYHAAVRAELPGAPVGVHCVYGQYTQLARALNETGDTLTVIPSGAKAACIQFKDQMRKKYRGPEYNNAIHEGVIYESKDEYDAALEKYLAAHGVNEKTTGDKISKLAEDFAATHYSADQIAPGSIMIVPRFRGSKNKFHAIMFLGRGRIENGNFIPDPSGRYMFTAHNREKIGDFFKSWDTSNVFTADVQKILQTEYAKELKRLESLPQPQMIQYIVKDTQLSPKNLESMSRMELIQLVHKKYFGEALPVVTPQPFIAQANIMNMKRQNGARGS